MRVVIAEDSALLRAGIERILTDAGHEVVAGVPDATNLLRLVNEKRPDLVVTGTYGRTGVRGATIGSTAETLLNTLPCDVLAIRPED